MRIDIVSPPFAGHLFPLLDLARHAQSQGIASVRVLSTEEAQPAVELSQLPLHPLLPGNGDKVREIAETAHRVGSNPFRLLAQFKMNLALMDEIRQQLLELWRQDRPDLVLADFVVPVAGVVAQQLEIPWWTSMPTPCALEMDSGTPSYLGGWTPRSGAYGQARDYSGRKVVRGFKRTVAFAMRKQLRQLGFASLYRPDGLESVYSPRRILALGFQPFEFPRNWPAHVAFIGPVTGCPPFPASEPEFVPGKKHILVTLGTHLWWAKDDALAMLQPLADLMPDCVFHFTEGRAECGAPPESRRNGNMHRYGFIPYDQYMHRYDAAIVHGGTGVLYSCLKAAVPMLVWPHDYDQFDHAARIVAQRLGLRCCPTVNSMAADLRQLMTDTEIRSKLQEFAGSLSQCHPHETLAEMLRAVAAKRSIDGRQ